MEAGSLFPVAFIELLFRSRHLHHFIRDGIDSISELLLAAKVTMLISVADMAYDLSGINNSVLCIAR